MEAWVTRQLQPGLQSLLHAITFCTQPLFCGTHLVQVAEYFSL